MNDDPHHQRPTDARPLARWRRARGDAARFAGQLVYITDPDRSSAAGTQDPMNTNNEVRNEMEQAQIIEWQALQKEHDEAHYQYLHVHTGLSDRITDAAKGLQRSTPLNDELDAHEAATERWYLAKRRLHVFCRTHQDVC